MKKARSMTQEQEKNRALLTGEDCHDLELDALRVLADACRRYVKIYDEFFPEHPVDVGENIEEISMAMQRWEEAP